MQEEIEKPKHVAPKSVSEKQPLTIRITVLHGEEVLAEGERNLPEEVLKLREGHFQMVHTSQAIAEKVVPNARKSYAQKHQDS